MNFSRERDIVYKLLKKISQEIDVYYNNTSSIEIARSNHIYEFIRGRKLLAGEFPTQIAFNRFLRSVYQNYPDILKAVIPNCIVDSSKHTFYLWKFYRKEQKQSNEVNAESVITPSNYYKEDRNVLINNNDLARSQQEKYLYNRLLNEKDFKVFYEKRSKGDKLTDFKVWNRKTNKVYRWEHFGMLENLSYSTQADEKIQWYKDKGFKFIQDGGTLIITTYRNDHEFHINVERMINLIKEL